MGFTFLANPVFRAIVVSEDKSKM